MRPTRRRVGHGGAQSIYFTVCNQELHFLKLLQLTTQIDNCSFLYDNVDNHNSGLDVKF